MGTTIPATCALRRQVERRRPVRSLLARALLGAEAEAALGEAFPDQALVLTTGERQVGLQDGIPPVTKPGLQGWNFIPSITSCRARLFPPVSQLS